MTGFDALDLAAKTSANLVRFEFEGGSASYTDLDSDQSLGGFTFASNPAMELELPKSTGALDEDSPLRVYLPIDAADPFLDVIASGEPHAPVTVTVTELHKTEVGAIPNSTSIVFRGELDVVTRNPDGHPGSILIECLPPKALLQVPLGIPCGLHCANTLFDPFCKVDAGSGNNTRTATLTVINSTVVTTTGMPGGIPDRYYHRGYLEYRGLRLMIQDWLTATPNTFYMTRRPPSRWIGQVVTVRAGCDKTIETCRARFLNESNFNGRGYGMPDYNPAFEVGG